MKKTRRFVALLLAAVLALALFTACGAAEQPQSAIGKVYEDWFVEQINSKRPGKPVQKVDVKHSDMMVALAKIDGVRKFACALDTHDLNILQSLATINIRFPNPKHVEVRAVENKDRFTGQLVHPSLVCLMERLPA